MPQALQRTAPGAAHPFVTAAAARLLRGSLLPAARRFRRALDDPEPIQRRLLLRTVRDNADTAWGRRHGFDHVDGVQAWQARVPVVDHDDLVPWIDRAAAGEPRVLTAETVRAFEPTSGSTGASKRIPYTDGLLAQFHAASAAWVHDVYSGDPLLARTRAYWAVSPSGPRGQVTEGGVPVGLEDDTEYLGPLARAVTRAMLVVPGGVSRIPDVDTWRYVTARLLLGAPDLGLLSVWSPSFLTLLLDAAERALPRIADDVEAGTCSPPSGGEVPDGVLPDLRPAPERAAALRAMLDEHGGLVATQAWPSLRLVSCWASGWATRLLPALEARLPGVAIQAKGLLATEGVVSIPLTGHPGAALAVTSHFLELMPVEPGGGDGAGPPRLAHRLDVGGDYAPILTTAGGLYRYRLRDRVRCVGRVGATPLVTFEGRLDGGSDLCGEKLTPARVETVIEDAAARVGGPLAFALLAPEGRPQGDAPPHYALFVEGPGTAQARALGEAVERGLREGFHYDRCRLLGQLGPVRVVPVTAGAARYEAGCRARGVPTGAVKPTALHPGTDWATWLT